MSPLDEADRVADNEAARIDAGIGVVGEVREVVIVDLEVEAEGEVTACARAAATAIGPPSGGGKGGLGLVEPIAMSGADESPHGGAERAADREVARIVAGIGVVEEVRGAVIEDLEVGAKGEVAACSRAASTAIGPPSGGGGEGGLNLVEPIAMSGAVDLPHGEAERAADREAARILAGIGAVDEVRGAAKVDLEVEVEGEVTAPAIGPSRGGGKGDFGVAEFLVEAFGGA